jgi:hypothetical protein
MVTSSCQLFKKLGIQPECGSHRVDPKKVSKVVCMTRTSAIMCTPPTSSAWPIETHTHSTTPTILRPALTHSLHLHTQASLSGEQLSAALPGYNVSRPLNSISSDFIYDFAIIFE